MENSQQDQSSNSTLSRRYQNTKLIQEDSAKTANQLLPTNATMIPTIVTIPIQTAQTIQIQIHHRFRSFQR